MSRYSVSQFTNGTVADATALDTELAKIATVINGGVDLTNITPGALDNTVFATAYDPVARAKDWITNYVVSGLTVATSASLSTTVVSGICYISGKKVTVSSTPITVVASKDTYLDIKDDGTVTQVAVANGATVGMTLTTNSDATNALRIAKLVSSGSAITAVSQGQTADPIGNAIYNIGPISTRAVSNPYKFSVYRNAAFTATNATAILFDTTLFDTGSNYASATGKFTAPVAGFYYFSAGVNQQLSGGSYGDVLLYKNGSAVLRGSGAVQGATGGFAMQNTVSGILQLAATDYVQVLPTGNSGAGGLGQVTTYFSGFLVSTS